MSGAGLPPEQVAQVARLARLKLGAQEQLELARELSSILRYMRKLEALDTADVPAAAPLGDSTSALRSDEVAPSLTRQQALANAPLAQEGHLIVPAIQEK